MQWPIAVGKIELGRDEKPDENRIIPNVSV
jgi:hypothetical protein